MVIAERFADLTAMEGLIDLTERVNGWKGKANFPENRWTGLSSNGAIYAVPAFAFVDWMYYRADYFEEAGLAGPPRNFDEFLSACRKLTDPSKGRYAFGMAISFREMRLTRPGLGGWVGFKHYAAMWSDPVFWIALKNTVVWVTAAVVLELALGLLAATALNRDLPGTKIFAVLILLPYFLPNVVAGHMWALLLDPRLGVINDLLVRAGVLHTYKA